MNKHLIRVAEPCLCGAEDCPRCYPEILYSRRRIDDDTADERAEQLRERVNDTEET